VAVAVVVAEKLYPPEAVAVAVAVVILRLP
jgi:hypothetical protein